MYFLIILFFTSLVLIAIMLGRKVVLLRNGMAQTSEGVMFEIPHLEKIKLLTARNINRLGHATLVVTIRFYVRSNNYLKNKYDDAKNTIKNRISKSANGDSKDMEVNKFLKKISEYKNKIRKIKRKIHEEENL